MVTRSIGLFLACVSMTLGIQSANALPLLDARTASCVTGNVTSPGFLSGCTVTPDVSSQPRRSSSATHQSIDFSGVGSVSVVDATAVADWGVLRAVTTVSFDVADTAKRVGGLCA